MSLLNPEAPEFCPAEFSAGIKNGFVTMNKTIRLSNNLPVGETYKKYRSVSHFDVVTQRISHNIFHLLNSIFVTELSSVRLREGDSEFNMERLIDANDSILDRIYMNIECVDKGVEPNQQNQSNRIGPGGYHSPIVTTIKMGSRSLTVAKNIPRPQLYFRERVDNSTTVWIPNITNKPNNIRPLALELNYNDAGELIGYVHPYRTELDHFIPKTEWLKADAGPPFPPPLEETNYLLINTEVQLDNLIAHLNTVDIIGVDLENHSYRSYQGLTSLIQISIYQGDYIIDPLALREYIHKLNEPFTNPKILKIFHGAEMDIQWLQRDFCVYVVGMFDTHQASILLKHTYRSLAALLERYCGLKTDKSYQKADWRLRPLTEGMVQYARMDTHYLPYIWGRMRNELLAEKNGDTELLLTAFKNSTHVCSITYNKPVTKENDHLDLHNRYKKTFNSQQLAALKVLFHWRDAQARTSDESPGFILPNHMLLALADLLPNTEQGISAICNPMPTHVKQNIPTILRMILPCREIKLEPQIKLDENENLLNAEAAADVHGYVEDFVIERIENVPENQESDSPAVQSCVNYDTINLSFGAACNFPRPFDRYQHYRTLAQQVGLLKQNGDNAKSSAPSTDTVKVEALLLQAEAKKVDDKGTKECNAQPSVVSQHTDQPTTSTSTSVNNNEPSTKKSSRKKKNKNRHKKNAQHSANPDARNKNKNRSKKNSQRNPHSPNTKKKR